MRLPIVCFCLLLQALAGFSQMPAIYDVIIHEVMPKPTPVLGLPPNEYIELKNISAVPVQLKNWHLMVNKREVTLPAYLLQPDSLLLLCAAAVADSYPIANVLGVDHFPPLADDSAMIVLYSPLHQVIHALAYNQHWYGSHKGGVSLEMINALLPCSGKSNWTSSTASAGGTPGKPNAASAVITDPTLPDLLYVAIIDSLHLMLQFSKTLDSALAADPGHYQLSGGLQIRRVVVPPPLFNNVQLQLSAAIMPQQAYTLNATGVADCYGAVSGLYNAATFGWPAKPEPGDVLFSEILFYPPPGVPEFIELYNNSFKVIDLKSLRVCAVKTNGSWGPVKQLATISRLLMPGQWLALTTDAAMLCNCYNCLAPESILEVSGLPSMPMEEGRLLLMRDDSMQLDELHYTAQMHFPLFSELRGISLERLQYQLPTSDGHNWHSAAATVGYATPGWKNSQRWPAAGDSLNIVLSPAVFSPNGDGVDDKVRLSWQLPAPGYMANVTIFDIQGGAVRYLARNMLIGNTGFLSWDGIGENAVVLASGIYIFFVEIFNAAGEVKHWKHSVVMARKLE
ncbi:hypothetical protein ACDQ55_02735 [Chitinophaga sp. 30R24]|uniref:hypothetical protein n=1 Tax=Chitinophaga sp. 30R24 TaxID=3248838 RepID=UPI003B8FB48A